MSYWFNNHKEFVFSMNLLIIKLKKDFYYWFKLTLLVWNKVKIIPFFIIKNSFLISVPVYTCGWLTNKFEQNLSPINSEKFKNALLFVFKTESTLEGYLGFNDEIFLK